MALSNNHAYSQNCGDFNISPLLQEKMLCVGLEDNYEKGAELLNKLAHVDVSKTQLHRVTDHYGEKLTETVNEERNLKPVMEEECLYVQADGSMVLTRDGIPRWKEVKLGRIFNSSDCIKEDGKPGSIRRSQYVGHLGGHTTFINKMNHLINSFGPLKEQLVFVSDGATWIRNWIKKSFPEATSILDFYHASQYLYAFANTIYSRDEKKAKQWADEQKELLRESKLPEVMENIKQLSPKSKATKKILKYYTENKDRMDYKRYSNMGAKIIGSGAIESANKAVIQKRMKLSGQRWSKKGAQNMLNLRVTAMNDRWDKVIEMVTAPKSRAA